MKNTNTKTPNVLEFHGSPEGSSAHVGPATVVEFPTLESKIKMLDALKARYQFMVQQEERIYEAAYRITGEANPNGVTLDWLCNNPGLTTAGMLAELEADPDANRRYLLREEMMKEYRRECGY